MKLVQMITTIDETEVIYAVTDGAATEGDFGNAKTIWERRVSFGQTDATVAGGTAFRLAAQEQERVAWELARS